MCPVCLTTLALIAGTTSAGGITALVVKKVRAKSGKKLGKSSNPSKEVKNESSKDRF